MHEAQNKDNSKQQFATLDDINAIVLVSDKNGQIIFANKAIKDILGYEPEELIGDGWWKLTTSKLDSKARKSATISLAKGESSLKDRHLYENALATKDGRLVWTQWTNTINAHGHLVGIAQDITQKKELERELIEKNKENELLLKEIHHRVKNNLQIISSMLNLQFNSIDDPRVREALDKSRNRINSMALIHSKIYLSKNLASIDFDDYMKELTRAIKSGYSFNEDIKLELKGLGVVFDIDLAINLGLILTELISNAYKHAFKESAEGRISIELKTLKFNKYQLIVEDNGEGIASKELHEQDTLGLEIVDALVEQINGTIETDSTSGLKYVITFEV
ncbi:MAG: PAS domain S-box-containing protein [Arenicella sp.]|jgi:PAS domain S-box-containing protein